MAKLLAVSLLLLLAACSTTQPKSAPSSSPEEAFRKLKDSAPVVVPADISKVKDAVPVPVKRTRAGNKSPYTVLGKTYRVLNSSKGYRQRGIGSWYGQKFHGRKTSNGETYNMFAMTAAHKTLPIPSYVRVTNLENKRSIIVRVNDRGPFHSGRIIDLSYAAAAKLGYVNKGTARVEVVDVTPDGKPSQKSESQKMAVQTQPPKPKVLKNPVWLQLGAFSQKRSALALGKRVVDKLGVAVAGVPVQVVTGADAIHRVRIGPLSSTTRIDSLKQRLAELGINSAYTVTK